MTLEKLKEKIEDDIKELQEYMESDEYSDLEKHDCRIAIETNKYILNLIDDDPIRESGKPDSPFTKYAIYQLDNDKAFEHYDEVKDTLDLSEYDLIYIQPNEFVDDLNLLYDKYNDLTRPLPENYEGRRMTVSDIVLDLDSGIMYYCDAEGWVKIESANGQLPPITNEDINEYFSDASLEDLLFEYDIANELDDLRIRTRVAWDTSGELDEEELASVDYELPKLVNVPYREVIDEYGRHDLDDLYENVVEYLTQVYGWLVDGISISNLKEVLHIVEPDPMVA